MHKWGTCQAEIKISWIETAFRLWRSIRHLGCLWMLTDLLLNSQPFLDKLKCCFVTQQSTVISSNSYSFHCHKTVCLCTRKIIQNSVHILNFLEKKLKLEYWTVAVKTQEDYSKNIHCVIYSRFYFLFPYFFLAKYSKIRGRGEDKLTLHILTSCEHDCGIKLLNIMLFIWHLSLHCIYKHKILQNDAWTLFYLGLPTVSSLVTLQQRTSVAIMFWQLTAEFHPQDHEITILV